MDKFAICIAGAGVIGLAIAQRLARDPLYGVHSIVLLEQESSFGQHISSRNSEVIHAGLYYPESSLKAALCVRGRHLLYEYCEKAGVAFKKPGKCIISLQKDSESLARLQAQAQLNGVSDVEIWSAGRLRQAEPAVVAQEALYSPSTGIIDSHGYMQSLLNAAQANGVLYAPFTRVQQVQRSADGFELETLIQAKKQKASYKLQCEVFINCAGLQAQELAASIEPLSPDHIPPLYLCKGDYFTYSGKNPFKHLIYPVPSPNTEGLGIHSTVDLSGQLRFGPDTNYLDEPSYSVEGTKAAAFAEAIQQYFPALQAELLAPAYAGIRPKLVPRGEPAADFCIQGQREHGVAGLVQLFGMESPGLTASLAIADHVANLI